MCLAIAIQHLFSRHTQARFERVFGIIETGVNDLGVATTRVHSDLWLGLEDEDFPSGFSQRARDGEADDTGTGDDAIKPFSHAITRWAWRP